MSDLLLTMMTLATMMTITTIMTISTMMTILNMMTISTMMIYDYQIFKEVGGCTQGSWRLSDQMRALLRRSL